jgi:hypothetical protein
MNQRDIFWKLRFFCCTFTLIVFHVKYIGANFMKLHKPQLVNLYNCNDHIEKLWLNIQFRDTTVISHFIDQLSIAYDVSPCVNAECGHFKNLTLIDWKEFYAKNKELIIQFNSFYKYKLEINVKQKILSPENINNSLSYKTDRICENLDFEKFNTCSQYLLLIENGFSDKMENRVNCTFELVKRNESKSFIKFIYLGIVVVFLCVLSSKIATIFYSKYKIIK